MTGNMPGAEMQDKRLQEAEAIKRLMQANRKNSCIFLCSFAALSALLVILIINAKEWGLSHELVQYKLLLFASVVGAFIRLVKTGDALSRLRSEYYERMPQERPGPEDLARRKNRIRKYVKITAVTAACGLGVLIFVLVANHIAAEEAYAEWKSDAVVCGVYDGVDWKITKDDELVIGNGTEQTFQDKRNRSQNDYPWYEYRYQIKAVSVEGKVKGQGSLAYMFTGIEADSWALSGLDVTEINDLWLWLVLLP